MLLNASTAMKLFPLFITLTSALNLDRFPPFNPQEQQHILSSHNNLPPWPKSPSPSFIALGDSYSAGIGTPLPANTSENACRQGHGAYPYLIHTDISSPFQWLSCTGSTTTDVLDPNSGQISNINTSLPTSFATLSIGGNDVGFFDVINACVFRFYSFYSGTCEEALSKAEGLVSSALGYLGDVDDGNKEAILLTQRLSLILLEILDKIRWETNPNFTILLTGYASFFNDKTEDCDEASLAVWWDSPATATYQPKLTRDTRRRMNALVRGVNQLLNKISDGANNRFRAARKKVLFIDYDDLFEGHRFCEEGVKEPDYERESTWFFLPGGSDSPASEDDDGKQEILLGEEDMRLVDPGKCLEVVEKSGDWGERALCYMALAKERHPELVLSPRMVASGMKLKKDSMWYVPTYYGKTFHPRSLGHQAIRDRLYEVWEEELGLKG